MGNLIYLIAALGLAALGTLVLVLRARKPQGMRHNIQSFNDQLDSLSPERRRSALRPNVAARAPEQPSLFRAVKVLPPEPVVEPEASPTSVAADSELATSASTRPEPSTPVRDSVISRGSRDDLRPVGSATAANEPSATSVDPAAESMLAGPAAQHHHHGVIETAVPALDPRLLDVPAVPDETSEIDRRLLASLAEPSPVDPSTLPPLEELLAHQHSPSDPLRLPPSDIDLSRFEPATPAARVELGDALTADSAERVD
jgi:hypothetical protein